MVCCGIQNASLSTVSTVDSPTFLLVRCTRCTLLEPFSVQVRSVRSGLVRSVLTEACLSLQPMQARCIHLDLPFPRIFLNTASGPARDLTCAACRNVPCNILQFSIKFASWVQHSSGSRSAAVISSEEAPLDQSGCQNCGMPADVTKRPDYDEEARKLFAALNLPVSGAASSESSRLHGYNNLDAVWKHPTTGAQVFIGNQTASVQRDILRQNGITHVVNCTSDMGNAFQGKDGSIAYFRFDLYKFFSALDLRSHRGVYEFFVPVFQWIDEAVESGPTRRGLVAAF